MADDDDNFSSLVSIIKIEPEEFQTIEKYWTSSSDEILRQKAGIFSDLVVVLETLPAEERTRMEVLKFEANEEQRRVDNRSVLELAKEGNAGKSYLEPHTCCLCEKIFGNRRPLKTHLINVHNRGTEMFCDLCPKIFRVTDQMARHMESHMKKAFACNICDFKSAHKFQLETHKKIHSKQERCKICNKQVASLKDHLRNHKKEACLVCNKVFSKSNLKVHVKIHVDKRYKCSDCNSAFSFIKELRRHKLEQHYEGKLHRCHCGSVFKTSSQLNSHQSCHENKRVICEVCNKKFAYLYGLRRHQRLQHLKTHGPMKIKGIEKRPKVLNSGGPFICDKCGSIFQSRKSFSHHFRIKHSIKPRFFCDSCPESFKYKYPLKKHMINHFKINPFTCKICEHKSTTKSNLNNHMLQHGPKTECKICHKMVANLYQHMRNHEKVKCQI